MNQNKNNWLLLATLLALQTIAVGVYTLLVAKNEGFIFVQVAIENVKSLAWIGQFTLDFGCYLILSALWIVWRNHYKPSSIIMAIVAGILGIVVFAPYLLYLLYSERGNVLAVLVGDRKIG